jgi:4-amino-4-deoxy-L-arabinose transferase-like glycosyltransferase
LRSVSERIVRLRARSRASLGQALTISIVIFALTFGLTTWHLNMAPDIFTDEIIYTRIGARVAGEGAIAWDSGKPFLVHPPLYFLVEGAYMLLTSDPAPITLHPGNIFAQVYHARYLNAIFAALTAVLLYVIGWRLRGPGFGLLLAALFMFDPFSLRTNRRAMLETMSAFLSWAGMAIVLIDSAKKDIRPFSARTLMAGALLGAGLLSKELTFTTLVVVLIFGLWELQRGGRSFFQSTLVSLGTASLIYAAYPLWQLASGQWQAFVPVKLLLLERLVGLVHLTGWNRPGVSLADFLTPRLVDYGSTFILFALAGLATTWLLLMHRHDRTARLLSVWGLLLYPFYAFLTLFGTANDQFFYYLVVPTILLIGYTVVVFPEGVMLFLSKYHSTRSVAVKARPWVYRVRGLLVFYCLCFVLPYNVTHWWLTYGTGTDNGYLQLTTFVQDNLPADAPINASGDSIKFRYFFPTRPVTTVNTPASAAAEDVHYFVVVPKDIIDHYGNITPAFAAWVTSHGQPLFSVYDNTYGEIWLYRVNYPSVASPTSDTQASFPPAHGGYVGSLLLELGVWGLILVCLMIWAEWRQPAPSFVPAPEVGGASVTQPMEARSERA